MKKRGIEFIIGLMLFALLGVIGMQYYFIRQSYLLKLKLFDETINAVLNSVALKAEKKELIDFTQAREAENQRLRYQQDLRERNMEEEWRMRNFLGNMKERQRKLENDYNRKISELREEYPGIAVIENWFYETYIRDKRRHQFIGWELKRVQEGIYDDVQLLVYSEKQVPPKSSRDDSVRIAILEPDRKHLSFITLAPPNDTKLEQQIAIYEANLKNFKSNLDFASKPTGYFESIRNELELAKRPLKSRIDAKYIVSQLKSELSARNIKLPNNIFISEVTEDERVLFALNMQTEIEETEGHSYSAVLFPNSLTNEPKNSGKLTIYFHNKNEQILASMGVMLGSSALLLIVLIACFAYTILTIIRQKNISEMKTDFINNMTHEFKTPVATIMIASESLKDPEISSDPKRANRLANIIYDENVRLGNHIERVLNIAHIDRGNLKIEMLEVHINELIKDVVYSMGLQLNKRKAQLTLSLEAKEEVVIGDELHFSNVVFNLVDNAIKYSKEEPNIHISTHNHSNQIVIKVRDSGIGMTRDQQSRIFDQFYRVSTGNLHDVKGFGLGLSYVQDIVKRLKGNIRVKSEKDKGSEFEIQLPLKQQS